MDDRQRGQRWQAIYAAGEQLNLYPYDEVVAWFSARYPQPEQRKQVRVLELGCGAGNNLWFLARAGFSCAGIEVSAAAIDFAAARLAAEGLIAELKLGSFTELPFAAQSFYVVLDRGSLAAVSMPAAQRAIAQAARVLAPGGVLLFTPFAIGTRVAGAKAELIGALYGPRRGGRGAAGADVDDRALATPRQRRRARSGAGPGALVDRGAAALSG